MTKKAKLYGNRANVEQMNVSLPPEVASNFELKEHIELSTTRSHSTEIKVDFEENDLVALHFSDQTEWIGHPEDIQEIFQDALDAENIPLTVAMEHTDEDPHFHGTASREYGLICVLENANVPFLHIEIPSAYRKNNQVANRNKMIDALSSALAQVKAANLID